MIQRILSVVLGLLLFAAVFLFTSFLLALALTAGLLLAGWTWWRSRKAAGSVIEGEYRIIRRQ